MGISASADQLENMWMWEATGVSAFVWETPLDVTKVCGIVGAIAYVALWIGLAPEKTYVRSFLTGHLVLALS